MSDRGLTTVLRTLSKIRCMEIILKPWQANLKGSPVTESVAGALFTA